MSAETIAAVVVTFNRKVLLCECLDALLSQSRVPDAIFVVDNASSDGTSELLAERGYLENAVIRYIRLGSNLGGAGGFHTGMKAAYESGYDWIWVMDDDTEPHRDSLEKLGPWTRHPGVVAVANRKLDAQGKDTGDGIRLMPIKTNAVKKYTAVRFSSFVGLLVGRTAIAKIGFPRQEFFIHWDDTEFCIRLRTLGDIALAEDSCVVHKEMARGQAQTRILGTTIYQEDIFRFCFGYYKHRNAAWVESHSCKNPVIGYGRLAGRFACFAAAVLAFDRDYRWLRIKILARAYWDGMRAHFDNTLPSRFQEEIRENASAANR